MAKALARVSAGRMPAAGWEIEAAPRERGWETEADPETMAEGASAVKRVGSGEGPGEGEDWVADLDMDWVADSETEVSTNRALVRVAGLVRGPEAGSGRGQAQAGREGMRGWVAALQAATMTAKARTAEVQD